MAWGPFSPTITSGHRLTSRLVCTPPCWLNRPVPPGSTPKPASRCTAARARMAGRLRGKPWCPPATWTATARTTASVSSSLSTATSSMPMKPVCTWARVPMGCRIHKRSRPLRTVSATRSIRRCATTPAPCWTAFSKCRAVWSPVARAGRAHKRSRSMTPACSWSTTATNRWP
ncbi:hypothetical protein D3C84_521150 [compost metagenome]